MDLLLINQFIHNLTVRQSLLYFNPSFSFIPTFSCLDSTLIAMHPALLITILSASLSSAALGPLKPGCPLPESAFLAAIWIGALGEPCSGDSYCANDAYCHAADDCANPLCGNTGAPCDTDANCAFNTCINGVCNGPKKASCPPRPVLIDSVGTFAPGEQCSSDVQCANGALCFAVNDCLIPICGNKDAPCERDEQCSTSNGCKNGFCHGNVKPPKQPPAAGNPILAPDETDVVTSMLPTVTATFDGTDAGSSSTFVTPTPDHTTHMTDHKAEGGATLASEGTDMATGLPSATLASEGTDMWTANATGTVTARTRIATEGPGLARNAGLSTWTPSIASEGTDMVVLPTATAPRVTPYGSRAPVGTGKGTSTGSGTAPTKSPQIPQGPFTNTTAVPPHSKPAPSASIITYTNSTTRSSPTPPSFPGGNGGTSIVTSTTTVTVRETEPTRIYACRSSSSRSSKVVVVSETGPTRTPAGPTSSRTVTGTLPSGAGATGTRAVVFTGEAARRGAGRWGVGVVIGMMGVVALMV
jgi:hypothetical protein